MKITAEELAELFEENPELACLNSKPLSTPKKRPDLDSTASQRKPMIMEKDFTSQINTLIAILLMV